MGVARFLTAAVFGLAAASAVLADAPASPYQVPGWRDLITPEDQARLDGLPETRVGAIGEADAAIAAKEQNALEAAPGMHAFLDAVPVPLADQDLIGRYRCRVAKLGGQYLQLIRYPFFNCRIQQGPDRSLMIKKTSGSQRFIGRLWREADALSYVYLGTTYVNDDQPIAYNTSPQENSVGRLFRISDGRLRLELPKPHYESNLDVIELVRMR